MKTILVFALGAALGAGATMVVNVYLPAEAKPAEVVRPVSWWAENKPQRTAKVAECRDNPGELATSANCRNAIEADTQAAFYGDGSPQPNILEGLKSWNR